MNEDIFAPKIEEIEKDDAEKIVNYRKAREKMKELLEAEEGSDSMQIKNLNPLRLEDPADKVIDRYDIEKVGDIVEKAQDKELVEKLTISLEKEKKEIEGIRDKLKTFKNDKSLDESGKNKLEEDREKVEKLELKIKNSEDELRKLE